MLSNYFFKLKKIRPLVTIKKRTFLFTALYSLGLLPNVICRGKIKIVQSLRVQGEGVIELGDKCVLGIYQSPFFYSGECYIEARNIGAKVTIGNRVSINNNATIIADKNEITIGDDTLIGPGFICFDSNFHPIDPSNRLGSNYRCRPVNIGTNVFIGANVTILQGVTIGDNSVIGSGVVVDTDVPNNTIVKSSRELNFNSIK
ncbi:hypothetical protein O1C43_003027 [Vibrio cholerae]|nr:transferase [Vibrio cholerae]EKF9603212.1 hypothetical protein [Vibrio cholerae]